MKYNEKHKCWVSKDGVVLYEVDGKLLPYKVYLNRGYEHVSKGYVHRLVYETFVGEIPEGYDVDHIDFDRSNNSLDNLRILTTKENRRRHDPKYSGPNKGRKLSDEWREHIRASAIGKKRGPYKKHIKE